MRFNAHYPGFERLLVEDLVVEDDRGMLRARVTGTGSADERPEFAVASFATVRGESSSGSSRSGQTSTSRSNRHAPYPDRVLPEPTERLRFRPMTMDDLADITAVLTAFDAVRGGMPPSTRKDAVRWVEWQERNYAEHDFGLWVVETHDGDFVGDCGLTVQDVDGIPHVEVGYHLVPEMRRRGYATEAARAVRDCAAAAGVEHLVALIRPDNSASQGVARRLGMEVERTAVVHGVDALVFGMRLAPGR